jgi:predicted component of type VI protein secretion system
MALLTVMLSLGAVLGISGCSGGSSSQPMTPTAQNYTVTVTAKDITTGVQNSTNFTLTVQ